MNKYWIWFSRINKIGAKLQNQLLEKYKSPEVIWNIEKEELEKFVKQEYVEILLDKKYRQNLEKYADYMKENKIKMLTIKDEKYPQKLRNLYDPPSVLYVAGNIDILNSKAIAIIGSRACTEYGRQVAKEFAYNLSKSNINIISGLAKGIDTYAHIGTINASKPTIAVVGGGLDNIYPKENLRTV